MDKKTDDTLTTAKQRFTDSVDAENDNREAAQADIEFGRLGEQWPEQVRVQREREGRPCLTFNKLPTFIRQVVNDSRMNRPAIRVQPVDSGADVKTAEILNGLIRNIEVTSDADVAYDTAIEQAVSGGFGYFRINLKYACEDSFDLDIAIERVTNQFTVYADPKSTAADSSDWEYAFITETIPREEFKERFPQAEIVDWSSDELDKNDELWFMEDTVRIAEYWTREKEYRTALLLSNNDVMYQEQYDEIAPILESQGVQIVDQREVMTYKVIQRVMTGAEILETNDWPGKYIPIVPVYGDEINIEGRRIFKSLIRDAKDAQQSYNFWRTSAIEKQGLDTKAPWLGPKGAFKTDAAKWATANTTNHAYLEYDGNIPPQRIFGGGVPAGDMQLALSANDDMKSIMGIYDASLGARSNETSGRAILARQREGDVSTFHFIDNLSRAIRHAGRILVDLIPKVYNTPRIIRVLGEDGQPAPIVPGQPPGRVPINQEVLMNNIPGIFDLTTGKYDVTVSSGPAFSSRREESAMMMIEMIRAQPNLAPIIGDLIAKNQDWPGADEIAKRIQAMLPPQLQGENPQVKQLQMQIQQGQQMMQQGQAQLANLQRQLEAAKTDKEADMIRLQIDREKLDIDRYNAETNRLKAQADAAAKAEQLRLDAMESALSPLMQRVDLVEQAIGANPIQAPKRKIKRAKAIKNPDGSWDMEAIEEEEPPQIPVEQEEPYEQGEA